MSRLIARIMLVVAAVFAGMPAVAFELDVDPEQLDRLDGKQRIIDLAVGESALASVFTGCGRGGRLFIIANVDVMDAQYQGMSHLRLKRLEGDRVAIEYIDKSTTRTDFIEDVRRVLAPSPCANNEMLTSRRYTYFEVATVNGMNDAASVLRKLGLGR